MPVYMKLLLLAAILLAGSASAQTDWTTHFERTGGEATPTYAQTMRYLERLDSASAWIRLESFGVTPEGRDLPLVILARGGEFTPDAARTSGKDILLIQSGIHAGEIDGKDASLMLLRDIAITRRLEHLAEHVIVLFMPIFNLDGHERSSPYNRINQNGPVEMGWRTTAQNLNLNRDYMKADAPEMRAWLRTFNAWMPDMLVDCHVTNGIDFQYNLSYAMEVHGNMAPPVAAWERDLERSFIAGMEEIGDPVVPYSFPRERSDIREGLIDWASRPRLSTGYAAIRNRANLLVETHMMKPFRDRVYATYHLLIEVLDYVRLHPGTLRAAVAEAERSDIARFANAGIPLSGDATSVAPSRGAPRSSPDDTHRSPLGSRSAERSSDSIAVHFRSQGSTRIFRFLGYETEIRKSTISGGTYVWWDRSRPVEVDVPFLDDVQPAVKVLPPRAYVIPQEWQDVITVLRLHGVELRRLREDARLAVETCVFSDADWRDQPYEGRFTVDTEVTTRIDTVQYDAGDYVVDLAQASGRVALHLLEPRAPDSFVYWGFFNAVFERKEYFEDYVMEEIAADMLAEDHALRAEFEARLAADSTFAASPRARLWFFYERSPWFDEKLNVYPVGRLLDETAIHAIPEKRYNRNQQIN